MSKRPLYYRIPTLFPTQKESSRVLDIGLDILRGNDIKKDEQGFCLIEDLCRALKDKDGSLGYINRNHIIEFFFKDADRKILISDVNKIKYKEIRYVMPPMVLYFGTVQKFVPQMKMHGIRSNTKGYIKLYGTSQEACTFAEKFAREGESTTAIKIDAARAFSEGLKFSTFKEGEYIVVQVNKGYIL